MTPEGLTATPVVSGLPGLLGRSPGYDPCAGKREDRKDCEASESTRLLIAVDDRHRQENRDDSDYRDDLQPVQRPLHYPHFVTHCSADCQATELWRGSGDELLGTPDSAA
jgi:hypothetical protein